MSVIIESIFPVLPATPWLEWTISLKTNRYALRSGRLYIRVSYDSAGGSGQSDATVVVTDPTTLVLILPLPGDAHNIHIIRLAGVIDSSLYETLTETATGTGVIVETGSDVCADFLSYEKSEISMLHSVTSASKKRRLFAGTRESILMGDDLSGVWRVLADGLGDNCGVEDHDTSISFKMVTMGDVGIFTNGFDPVLGFKFNDQPQGDRLWSADYVLDLEALRITSARVIGKFQGFVLLGDIVADGVTLSSRLIWSDFNNPLAWIPGGQSAAGFTDFGRGEIIRAIEALGGFLRIYTSQAIYEGSVTQDVSIFSFQEIYRNEDSASMVRYPNSFVNTGSLHLYMGADSIYTLSQYDRIPQRVEWLHAASGVIYQGITPVVVEGIPEMVSYPPIDRVRCELPRSGYDNLRQAAWWSWPAGDSLRNNVSLVVWPRYKKASVINYGFTAFTNHRPDHLVTLRDWIASFGICPPITTVVAKEGLPFEVIVPPLGGAIRDPGFRVVSTGPSATAIAVHVGGIVTGPIPLTRTISDIPKWDTGGGTLTQVQLDLVGNVRSTPKFESLNTIPRTYDFGSEATVTLTDPLGAPWISVHPVMLFHRNLGVFDGDANYKSPPGGLASGISPLPQTGSAIVSVIVTAANNPILFAAFQGGPADFLTFVSTTAGNFLVTSPTGTAPVQGVDYVQDIKTEAGVNFNISYTVDTPVYVIRGKIWADANADGILDPDELGIPGVMLTVMYGAAPDGSDGLPIDGVAPIVTNNSGEYEFRFVLPPLFEYYLFTVQVTPPPVGTLSGPPTYQLSPAGPNINITFLMDTVNRIVPNVDLGFSGVPDVVPPPTLDDAINAMCGFCLTTLCEECDSDVRFLMATTGADISIKEYAGQCGQREVLTGRKAQPFPVMSVGCYEQTGFTSLLQQRLYRYATTANKFFSAIEANISTPAQDPPATIYAQAGVTDCADNTRWAPAESRLACDSDVYPILDADAVWSGYEGNMHFSFTEEGQYITSRIYSQGLGSCFTIAGLSLWLQPVKR